MRVSCYLFALFVCLLACLLVFPVAKYSLRKINSETWKLKLNVPLKVCRTVQLSVVGISLYVVEPVPCTSVGLTASADTLPLCDSFGRKCVRVSQTSLGSHLGCVCASAKNQRLRPSYKDREMFRADYQQCSHPCIFLCNS